MTDFSRLRVMRAAARVQRMHTTPSLHKQTVGEHTFGVLAILNEVYSGDLVILARLTIAVLQHDVPEVFTGDVPAPAKWMYPELEAGLRIAEQGVQVQYDLGLGVQITEAERRLLKYCDLMELAIFAMEEFDMGNKPMAVMCTNALIAVNERGLERISDNTRNLYEAVKADAHNRFGAILPLRTDAWHGIALTVQEYRLGS